MSNEKDNSYGRLPMGIDMGELLQKSLRLRSVEEAPQSTFCGFFEYIEKDDGWGDSIRVVDDDGMPFHLSGLKRFNGRAVRITIEWTPEDEQQADNADGENSPLIYKAIGQTPPAYTAERKRLQSEFNSALLEEREKQ